MGAEFSRPVKVIVALVGGSVFFAICVVSYVAWVIAVGFGPSFDTGSRAAGVAVLQLNSYILWGLLAAFLGGAVGGFCLAQRPKPREAWIWVPGDLGTIVAISAASWFLGLWGAVEVSTNPNDALVYLLAVQTAGEAAIRGLVLGALVTMGLRLVWLLRRRTRVAVQ